MRLIRYPPNDAPMDDVNVGISAHTDFECFTLMHQTATGLQVKTVGGEWVQLPARSHQLLVILDDMLEIWTNGVLAATQHRVPNTPWKRSSLIMFCAVDSQTLVEPLADFIDNQHPARFRPVTQGEQIDNKFRRAQDNLDEMKRSGQLERLTAADRDQ